MIVDRYGRPACWPQRRMIGFVERFVDLDEQIPTEHVSWAGNAGVVARPPEQPAWRGGGGQFTQDPWGRR